MMSSEDFCDRWRGVKMMSVLAQCCVLVVCGMDTVGYCLSAGGGDRCPGLAYGSWLWWSDSHGARNHPGDLKDLSPEQNADANPDLECRGRRLRRCRSVKVVSCRWRWWCWWWLLSDQTSVWLPCDDTVGEPETEEDLEKNTGKNLCHTFISKTVKISF